MSMPIENITPQYKHILGASKATGISRYHLKQLITAGVVKSVTISKSVYINMDDLISKLNSGSTGLAQEILEHNRIDVTPLLDGSFADSTKQVIGDLARGEKGGGDCE